MISTTPTDRLMCDLDQAYSEIAAIDREIAALEAKRGAVKDRLHEIHDEILRRIATTPQPETPTAIVPPPTELRTPLLKSALAREAIAAFQGNFTASEIHDRVLGRYPTERVSLQVVCGVIAQMVASGEAHEIGLSERERRAPVRVYCVQPAHANENAGHHKRTKA